MSALPKASGSDTIAAIATAPGAGGIGIVRISGPSALAVADRIFRDRKGRLLAASPDSRLVLGIVSDPTTGAAIDEVLCVHMPAGRSYTGEPTVEVQGHGGSLVLESILKAALASGARLAGPGDYTRRAFLSGRLDLAQAEAVCALIGAEDEEERRAAVLQLGGAVSKGILPLRERLLDLLARVEAALDLEEGEVPVEIPAAAELETFAAEIRELAGGADGGPGARRGVRVVLAGRPNSGKSSIFNYLLEFERSLVSSTPGTTRDYVEGRLMCGGVSVTLVDTAGFRESNDAVEVEGVRRSLLQFDAADVAALIYDGSQPNHADDERLLEMTRCSTPLVVINKTDLPSKFDATRLGPLANGLQHFKVSALTGRGLPEFFEELGARCRAVTATGATARTHLNLRHREALGRTAAFLDSAAELSGAAAGSVDMIAAELHAALDALHEITGETADEEILDRIFSRFCVGK